MLLSSENPVIPKRGAPRSELKMSMLAGGKHTLICCEESVSPRGENASFVLLRMTDLTGQ